MATADTTAPRGWSRRRALLALLAVSAVLNLFFVAGAVWTRMNAPAPPPTLDQRYQEMAAELRLDPQQHARFDRYVAAMSARSKKMHEAIAPLITGAWNEIAKPQADQAKIMQRFDDASQKWREFQHESTVETLAFLATLSPAQRSKFVAMARERRAPWQHSHHQSQ